MKTDVELREEIIRLGPWHLDVEVTPTLSTRVSLEAPEGTYPEGAGPVAFQDIRGQFRSKLTRVYPDGLEGRSMLDCACNCGGYLFWGKELGAGRCFGSDVREHWIDQARFLLEHREGPSDDLRFEVHDLFELPRLGLEPFDITIFGGVFYHLADPITGLRIAADLTKELMLFDTQTRSGQPDGFLAVEQEPSEPLMSGVHGLNWLPTGPEVVEKVLHWAGFVEVQLVRWIEETIPGYGRFGMLASKKPGLLAEAASRDERRTAQKP